MQKKTPNQIPIIEEKQFMKKLKKRKGNIATIYCNKVISSPISPAAKKYLLKIKNCFGENHGVIGILMLQHCD